MMYYDIIAATSVLAVQDQHVAAISQLHAATLKVMRTKQVSRLTTDNMAPTSTLTFKEQHAAAVNGQRAAARGESRIEELKKKDEKRKARKVLAVAKQARKAKDSVPAKARTVQKKLPFTGPSPAPRNCEHEDADDEEIIIKPEPLHDTRSFQQVASTSASTTPPTRARTASISFPTTSAAPDPIPSTCSPHQPTHTLTTTTPSRGKDKRRMALMLELKRIEVEKKRVELRELEMQLRIMELEVGEY